MKKEKIICKHCEGLGFREGFSGASIRKTRVNAEISLRQMARTLGFSVAFISDVELGRRNPNKEIIDYVQNL